MRDEERAFLEEPRAVFNARQYDVLRAIQTTVDLDYFGIDCGLDRAGNVVVFEVNASMLVHQNNERFPYKIPFVRAIKRAFDDMLVNRRAAAVGRACEPISSAVLPSRSYSPAVLIWQAGVAQGIEAA